MSRWLSRKFHIYVLKVCSYTQAKKNKRDAGVSALHVRADGKYDGK